MAKINLQRRSVLKALGSLVIGGWSAQALAFKLPPESCPAAADKAFRTVRCSNGRLLKAIPSTGEMIPVIGMGTWRTFNVGDNPRLLESSTRVLQAFYEHGGGMIDSSPMYGSAEAVLGHTMAQLQQRHKVFAATKVWTSSTEEGVEQIGDSKRLWGIERFELFQVHNLLNWESHLKTLLQLKEQGSLRYVGITTSHGRRHGELAAIMESEPIDFVQLTYNISDREVEESLLPLALKKGIAVIANRPFQGGRLMHRYEDSALPAWAQEAGINNWPEYFLKFVISHPAITCAIPATSQVEHMHENMTAMVGQMPQAETRQKMIDYINQLS